MIVRINFTYSEVKFAYLTVGDLIAWRLAGDFCLKDADIITR